MKPPEQDKSCVQCDAYRRDELEKRSVVDLDKAIADNLGNSKSRIRQALAQEDTKIKHEELTRKGQLNIYTCRNCFGHVVTKDVDYGVTPFMIGCRAKEGCKGTMQSSMYRVFDPTMRHDYEWFKPEAITDEMSQWEREHWVKGGLFLRKADHGTV